MSNLENTSSHTQGITPAAGVGGDTVAGDASPPLNVTPHARGSIPNAEPSTAPFLSSLVEKARGKKSEPEPPNSRRLGPARRKPTAHHTSYSWEINKRNRYHEYVHNLALAGWDNLKRLDQYMNTDVQDTNLVVSVVDIKSQYEVDVVQDLYSLGEVEEFLKDEFRGRSKVRLYLVEHSGSLQSSMIDCLGSHLEMDPRFFATNLFGPYMIMSPADRHRAPFLGMGFTILKPTPSRATETKFFRVSIYVKPDPDGFGWCGVILFNSHSKIQLSPHTLAPPPAFGQEISGITPSSNTPKSIRELYIDSLKLSNISQAVLSPFYAISPLMKLNFHCWNEVINTIRTEDRRLKDISEASFGHVEEIQHTVSLIERFGTMGWNNDTSSIRVQETQEELLEDFKHLLHQTDLLWEERRNMASVRDRQRQAKWVTLTNSFTFVFVPISLISSIYGMNVTEISGNDENPRIWQFFVACFGLNIGIVLLMGISHFYAEMRKHRRLAGMKEVWAYATNMGTTKTRF